MTVPAASGGGYRSVLERAAADPNIDIDKLERLVVMQEAFEKRQAELVFNEAMAAAQAEMPTIANDSWNPQTRSRYSSLTAILKVIRPIYTKHGIAVTFDEQPSAEPSKARIVAFVTCGSHIAVYHRDIPVSTTGIQGKAMMTPTHASASAVTYARRYLLTMIFNLDSDDLDGNPEPVSRSEPPPLKPIKVEAPHDPETGEVLGPHKIEFVAADDQRAAWQQWGALFVAAVRASDSEAVLEQWCELNRELLDEFQKAVPRMLAQVTVAVNKERNRLKLREGGTSSQEVPHEGGNDQQR